MSRLIERRYQTLFVNTSKNAAQRSLARRVDDRELFAKVTEDRTKETKGISNYDVNALGVTVVGDESLRFDRYVREDNNLVLVELGKVLVDTLQID